MSGLFAEYALGNTLLAAPLALLAWSIGRSRRYPSLAHLAWVLVMVRLAMPPIAALPWLSISLPLPRSAASPADGTHEPDARMVPTEPRDASVCAPSPRVEFTTGPDQPDRSSPRPHAGAEPPKEATPHGGKHHK